MRKVVISLICFSFAFSLFALNVGDKVSGLRVSSWLKNGAVSLYPKNEKDQEKDEDAIYVIFFFTTWSNVTPNVFRYVNDQIETFKDLNIKFIGISPENGERVKQYLKKYPDIRFHLGVDDHSKTWDDYMDEDSGVPMFFIVGSNKKLIWKGSPLEAQKVLIEVVGGTFDIDKQNQLEAIHKEIAKASQTFDFDAQKKYADEALKIDPTDREAIEVKIDDYIKKNQVDQCIKFLNDSRKYASSNKYLQYYFYMSLLDIARGVVSEKGKSYIETMSKDYFQTFQNSPAALNIYAIRLLQVPLEITSLKYALDMSNRSVELQRKIDPASEDLGVFLGTDARIYYMLGKMDKAIELQKESLKYIKDEKLKEKANLTLEFYESSKKLSENLKYGKYESS